MYGQVEVTEKKFGGINARSLSDYFDSLHSGNQTKEMVNMDFFKKYQDLNEKNNQLNLADDSTGVWGDPHYHLKGTNGQDIKFDHMGKANNTYNVFNGDGISIDGRYEAHDPSLLAAKDILALGEAMGIETKLADGQTLEQKLLEIGEQLPEGKATVIGLATIKAGSDTITYDRTGKVTLNGKDISNGTYDLSDGSQVQVNNGKAKILSKERDSAINISSSGYAIDIDPTGNFARMGGIIGEAVKRNRALTVQEANSFDIKGNFEYDMWGDFIDKSGNKLFNE